MSKELETKIGELAVAVEAFKKTTDRIDALEKKSGHAPADFKEVQDKTNDAISKIQVELAETKAALARGSQDRGDQNEEKKEMAKKHFDHFMRKGQIPDGMKAELKALSMDSDADGGFLASVDVSAEIVKKQFETSPLRQYASQQNISSNALEILEDLDDGVVVGTSEVGARVQTASQTLKKIVISAHEMYAMPLATQTSLDDAAINLEAWLADKVGGRFGRQENTNFIKGNGVGQAKGILSYAAGTGFNQVEQIACGTASVISPDDLFNLLYSLKSDYRSKAIFGGARDTIKVLRKLKDSQARYLWEPGLNGAAQEMILGRPLIEMNDMDAVAAVPGNLSMFCGDMKEAYQIVDRQGTRIIRDIYSAKPYVQFYTTKRSGGGVKNFEALKLLKIV